MHDAEWRQVLTILACTAAWAAKRVEAVPPASTSQACSGCGKRTQLSLRVRTPVGTHCGLMLDRDLNAARNSGQRLRGLPAVAGGMNREPVGL
jgi:putative transposase